MKLSAAQILLIAGECLAANENTANEEKHWQERWHKKIKNSILLHASNLDDKEFSILINDIQEKIQISTKPVILVAHGYGVSCALNALTRLNNEIVKNIKGGFFVAPSIHDSKILKEATSLPFPSFMISSSNDEYLEQDKAKILAEKLGSFYIDSGESAHIDKSSGHGPWPEGMLVFSQFINRL